MVHQTPQRQGKCKAEHTVNGAPMWLKTANLLVEGRDGLDGRVAGVDVNPLLGVAVEVQQRRHQLLDEGHGLPRHVPRFQLPNVRNRGRRRAERGRGSRQRREGKGNENDETRQGKISPEAMRG